MKILYLSPEYNTLSIANKLVDEGHTVYFWTKLPDPSANMGLKMIESWESYVSKVDLIIYDDVSGLNPDKLRNLNKPLVAGNSVFDRLENDRVYGKGVFKFLGLTVSDCVKFTNLKEGMEFIKKNPDKWVFKANGQASRTLGYVGKKDDGSDVIERMMFYEEHMKTNKKLWDKKLGVDYVLERCVDGIEVACGAYWDGSDFTGLNINWEHKKLGVGNVGIATGEMGTAIRSFGPDSYFYLGTLAKLKPLLKKFPYRTYVDLNCIVNKDNAYILEITSRLGYPIEAGLDYMSRLSTADRLMLLGSGKLHEVKKFWHDEQGVAVVCGTYGFPYESAYDEMGAGQPFKFEPKDKKQIHLVDVDKEDGHYITSENGEGYVCVVCGSGSSIEDSRKKAFDCIKRIDLPGIYYREDIGAKADDQYRKLRSWGWI